MLQDRRFVNAKPFSILKPHKIYNMKNMKKVSKLLTHTLDSDQLKDKETLKVTPIITMTTTTTIGVISFTKCAVINLSQILHSMPQPHHSARCLIDGTSNFARTNRMCIMKLYISSHTSCHNPISSDFESPRSDYKAHATCLRLSELLLMEAKYLRQALQLIGTYYKLLRANSLRHI